MEEMKNLGVSNDGGDEGFDNLTNMLGGLLKNLTSETGLEGVILSHIKLINSNKMTSVKVSKKCSRTSKKTILNKQPENF